MKLSKKLICLLVGSTITLCSKSFAGSYISGIDLEYDIRFYKNLPRKEQTYESWFRCENGTYWGDLIYNDINELLPPFLLEDIRFNWNIRLVDDNFLDNKYEITARGVTVYYGPKMVYVEGNYLGKN